MKNPSIFYIFWLFGAVFWAEQTSAQNFQTTPSGLRYELFSANSNGRKAQIGDFITIDMRFTNEQGQVLQEQKGVSTQLAPTAYNGDPTEIFTYLAEGDSVVVYSSVDSLMQYLQQTTFPPNMPSGSNLVYYFKVLKIQTATEFQETAQQAQAQRKDQERQQIREYLEQKGLLNNAKEKGDGLFYIKRQEGKGASVAKGQIVKVHYTGMLMNGKIFDNSYDRGEPIEFSLGTGRVIKGWDEGIDGMKVGEVGLLIIPSHLAYGERGAGSTIPPNSILIFEVELVEYKDAN